MAKKDVEGKDLNDLISIAEAARLRNVSHTAIQDLIRRNKLSSVEIGGRRFVKRTEVQDFQPESVGRPLKSSTSTEKRTTTPAKRGHRVSSKKSGKK